MLTSSGPASASILPQLVRAHLRSPFRGKTRLTLALARRFPSLQAVPVEIDGHPVVYLDLRDPSAHGYFEGSPHRDVPWAKGETTALRTLVRPGDVALDIGANRGFATAVLAAAVGPTGRVVAFEPNPAHRPTLHRTVEAIPHAQFIACALGECETTLPLVIPGEEHEMASFAHWRPERPAVRVPVPVHSLDAMIADGRVPRPDVMKIDVEGGEMHVFRGARATLDREDAPALLFEANPPAARALGYNCEELARWLLALPAPRYTIWADDWAARSGRVGWIPLEELPGVHANTNLIAVPAARQERWRLS